MPSIAHCFVQGQTGYCKLATLRCIFERRSAIGDTSACEETGCRRGIVESPRSPQSKPVITWSHGDNGRVKPVISNTDDHLRNHGFLDAGQAGWRLSPAYDLNPVPVDIKPRILTTTINEDDGTASLDLAMTVADYFELDKDKAKAIAAKAGEAVSTWRDEAARSGIGKGEIDHMASAFEHGDLKQALEK